jgi:hypothetical protein
MTVYTSTEAGTTYMGLTTDTKPVENIIPGARYLEADSGVIYIWCGDPVRGTDAGWYPSGESIE